MMQLQRPQELHEVLLLRLRELGAQHEIEELDRILEGQQAAVSSSQRIALASFYRPSRFTRTWARRPDAVQ